MIAISLPNQDRVTSSHPAPGFLIHFFFGYLLGTCVPGKVPGATDRALDKVLALLEFDF